MTAAKKDNSWHIWLFIGLILLEMYVYQEFLLNIPAPIKCMHTLGIIFNMVMGALLPSLIFYYFTAIRPEKEKCIHSYKCLCKSLQPIRAIRDDLRKRLFKEESNFSQNELAKSLHALVISGEITTLFGNKPIVHKSFIDYLSHCMDLESQSTDTIRSYFSNVLNSNILEQFQDVTKTRVALNHRLHKIIQSSDNLGGLSAELHDYYRAIDATCMSTLNRQHYEVIC